MGEALSYFIWDDRRTVPSLVLVVGRTEDQVREMAIDDLRTNPHRYAIEVMADDRLVFRVTRDDLSLVGDGDPREQCDSVAP